MKNFSLNQPTVHCALSTNNRALCIVNCQPTKCKSLKSILVIALLLCAHSVWGTATYTKVTTAPDNWSGTYLLVRETSSTQGQVFTGIDAASGSSASIDISSSTITSDDFAAYEVTLEVVTGGYSIRVSSSNGTNPNKYMYGKHKTAGDADNGLQFSDDAMVNTLSFSDGLMKFVYTLNEVPTYFLWNNMTSGSGGQRFRYYKAASSISSSVEQYLGFAMYKKQNTTTYTDYLTDCAAVTNYDITTTLANVTGAVGNPTQVTSAMSEVTLNFTANTGYELPSSIIVKEGTTTLVSGDNYEWNATAGQLDIIALDATSFSADLTIEISGSAKTYDVTLDKNNHATTDGSMLTEYLSTETYVDPHVTGIATGYSLKGYYTAASGGSLVVNTSGVLQSNVDGWTNNSGQWIRTSGEMKLYAQYTPTEYTLTYEGLEGTTHSNPTIYTIESATITLTDPSARAGYSFSGWTCGGSPITTIATGSTGNKTITAQWSALTPSITAHPASATYTQGASATALSVTATLTSGTLGYQWQSSSDNSSWNNISGATNSTFTPSTISAGTTYYRCVVSNATAGSGSATSNVATITVNASSVKYHIFVCPADVWGSSYDGNGVSINYQKTDDSWSGVQAMTLTGFNNGGKVVYGYEMDVNPNTSLKTLQFINHGDYYGAGNWGNSNDHMYKGYHADSHQWTDIPSTNNASSAYLVGSFNSWVNGDPNYALTKQDGNHFTGTFVLDGANENYLLKVYVVDEATGWGYQFSANGYWFNSDNTTATQLWTNNNNDQIVPLSASGRFLINVEYFGSYNNHGQLTITRANLPTASYAKGGSGDVTGTDPATASYAPGEQFTLPDNPYTRNGYNFAGWNDGANTYSEGATYTMGSSNVTLTAQWNTITYNLTYDNLQGASNTNPSTYTIETNTITLVNPGERAGYNFSGWTCGGNPITQIVKGSTGDKTISATWTAKTYSNYRTSCTTVTTLTLAAGDHGTAAGTATIKNGTSTFITFTDVTPAEHFVVEGYYDGSTKVINADHSLVSGVSGWTTNDGKWAKDADEASLTAKYTQLYQYSYAESCCDGGYAAAGATIDLCEDRTKQYHHFTGWSVVNNSTSAAVEVTGSSNNYHFTMPAASVTITPQFERNTYTVTTNDNGVATDHVVNEGESYTMPALSCVNTDYTKVGWTADNPTSWNEQTSTPTIKAVGSTVSEAGTYYAVYSKTSAPIVSNNYELIGESGLESGKKYLIVTNTGYYTDELYAMNNTFSSGTLGRTSVEANNDVIASPASSVIWTITGDNTTGYSIVNGTNYVGVADDALNFTSTPNTIWHVSFDNTTVTIQESTGNTYIKHVDEAFSTDWYGSGDLYIYKQKIESSTTYYSQPDCRLVTGIEVETAPTKTEYTEGQTFDPTGLVITVSYDAGAPADVAYAGHESSFSFTPSLSTPLTNETSVTITYGGQSTTQDITVTPLTKWDVKFYNNGAQVGETMHVVDGQPIGTLPTPSDFSPAITSCDGTSPTFIGWTEASISSAEKAHVSPTIITSAEVIEAAKNYNAVWASGTAAMANKTLTVSSGTAQAYDSDPVGLSSDGYTWNFKGYRDQNVAALQMKSGAYYIQLPTNFGSNIDYITFEVTASDNSGKTKGGSSTSTVISFKQATDGEIIASSEDTYSMSRTITLPANSTYSTGYLMVNGAIRIWSVTAHFKASYDNYMTYCCTQHNVAIGTITGGNVTSDKASACEGETVTLTPAPGTGCGAVNYDVYKQGESSTKVTVTDNAFTMPAYDVTVDATFAAATYTVSYNKGTAEGVTGSISDMTKTHDIALTLSSETFSRYGFTQTGWATTDGGEKAYDLGGTYSDNAAITLYPVWTEDLTTTWVLKGNFNEEDWNTPHAFAKNTGESAGKVAYTTFTIPVGESGARKQFKLWNSTTPFGALNSMNEMTSADCGDWTMASPGNDVNITFTASGTYTMKIDFTEESAPHIWVTYPTAYTITFDGNTNDGGSTDNMINLALNQEVTLNANGFTKTCNDFVKWNTEADGSGTAYLDKQVVTVTGNLTLYAQWAISRYDAIYDANGVTGFTGELPATVTYDCGSQVAIDQTKTINKFGYTFIGWNTNPAATEPQPQAENPFTITEDTRIYAIWDVKKPTEIAITPATGTNEVSKGTGVQMNVTLTPAASELAEENREVTWSSSNTTIASVNQSGYVTFVGTGSVTITATSKVNGSVLGQYIYTVGAGTCDGWMISAYDEGGVNASEDYFKQIGSSNEWRVKYILPNPTRWFWVGGPDCKWSTHSKNWTFNGIHFKDLRAGSCGANPYPGQDAVGELSIFDNSGDENYYVAFLPNYKVSYMTDDEHWRIMDFHSTSTAYAYETDIFQVPEGYKDDADMKYYVGIEKNDGSNMSVDGISSQDAMNGVNGLKDADMAGKFGKWHIWSNSCNSNWYCEFNRYYQVRFEMNGGDGNIDPIYGYAAADPVETFSTGSLTNPTRTGYTLTGWKDQDNNTYTTDQSVSITKDLVLTAQWQVKTYTITFDKNEGIADGGATATYDSNVLNPVTHVARTGYNLTGYFTASEGGDMIVTAAGELVANKAGYTDGEGNWKKDAACTLFAQWEAKTYNVTLSAPDAENVYTTAVEATFGNAMPAIAVLPTRAHYTFAGYYYNDTQYYTGAGASARAWDIDAVSPVLTAHWDAIPSHTVSWVVNGSSYSTGSPTTDVEHGGKVTTLPTAPAHSTLVDDCASEANHFMGWSVTDVGVTPTTDPGNIFTDAEHSPAITSATTFYAVFAKETSGKGPDIVITPNFNQTPAPYGLSTSSTSEATEYTMEGYKFTVGGTHNYASYLTTYWLQLGVTTSASAYIQFPAIENYKLTHATAVVKNNSSTNADVSICPTNSTSAISGGTETAVTSPMNKTWDLTGTSVNTAYQLYVAGTNSSTKNIQFTSISLTYESEIGVPTYSDYVTACKVCTNEITITKGAEVNGTFTVSPTGTVCIDDNPATVTVTPSPATHYYCSAVTSTGGGDVSAPVDGVYTISNISANTTINVTFTASANPTITWYVNNDYYYEGEPTTSMYQGDNFNTMTLPTAPNNDVLYDACQSVARKFVGWSTTDVGWATGSSAPAVLFTTAAEAGTQLGTMGKEDVTFYAVFAEEVVEATTWEEFVADGSMTTCDFVIAAIYDNKYYGLANTYATTTAGKVSGTDITSYVSQGIISAANATGCKFTFTKTTYNSTSCYNIKGATHFYGSSNDANLIAKNTVDGGAYYWTVGAGTRGTYDIRNMQYSTRSILFNGTQYASYVGSSSYYGAELLPIASGTPTYQNYVTECCPVVSAPTNLNATPAVDGGTVYWTKSDNATAYEIQVNGGDWTNVGDVNSYTISGIACGGTAVNWNIRALNNCYTSTHVNSSFYTAPCNCDGFQFHYRDFNGIWNTNNICFSAVDGTEHDQLTDEFALPYANAFNVTWQGSPLSDNKTKTTDFQYMGYLLQDSKNFGVNPQNGNMGGALGKMHIYDNSGADNMYVQWIPTGYTLQMGDGSNWPTTYNFTGKTSAWNETEWYTDLITVTDAQLSGKYFVGLKTANGYVWCGTYSEVKDMSSFSISSNKTGKFRIYANSSDKNWYVSFIPHLRLTYNANGGSGEMDPSAWHSVEETDEQRTITVAANTFTAPSGKAFRGWNKSADGTGDWINVNSDWVLRENISNVLYAIWENSYPVRYTGTTTGAIDHYAAEGATETLKANPVETGYTFTGWTITKDGGGTISVIDPEANPQQFIMPADGVTIHANMMAALVTLNYFDMGGTSCTAENIGSLPVTHTYGTPTILPAGVKAGYRFDGWHLQADCSDAAIAELAANVDYANPLAVYAKWTQVQTISFFENGVERTDLAQQAAAGEIVSMPAASGIGCGDYQTFLGWVVGEVAETTTAPANIYEAASSFTATGEAVAMHALYTKVIGGDGSLYYEKTTTVTDGTYLIAATNGDNSFVYVGKKDGVPAGDMASVSIADDKIVVKPINAVEVTVALGTGANAGKFSIYDGKYIYGSESSGGNLAWTSDQSFAWQMADGNIKSVGMSTNEKTFALRYNTSQPRLGCYQTNNTNSKTAYLYEKKMHGTRYYSTTADMKYTWHSGDADVQYTHVACLEEITPATPVACDGKTFMGWSKTEVADIQSAPIALVDFSTYEQSGDDEFWAVYATQNGGKISSEETLTHSEDFTEVATTSSYGNGSFTTASGLTWNYTNMKIGNAGALTSKGIYWSYNSDRTTGTVETATYVKDASKISISAARASSASYYIYYKVQGGASWTALEAQSPSTSMNTYTYEFPQVGDYYIKIECYKYDGTSNLYVYVDDINVYTKPRTYWYADYSTNCNKPATTTLTYDVNGGEEISPVTETGWVTLPTPTRGCYTFNGWKVTEPDGIDMTFMGGEKYLFNHDATLTAQWSEDTEAAAATITFHKGYGHNEVVNVNCHTPFVAPNPEETCDDELTFIGWSTTEITAAEGQSTKPTLFNVGEPLCELLGDIDLYPVYKKGVASGTDYTAGATGDFILAAKYDDTWYAIRNNPEVNDGSIAGNVITVNTASTVDYVLEQDATGYIWSVSNNGDNGQRFFDGTYYLYPTGGGTSGSSKLGIGKTGDYITNYGWDVTKPAKWNIQATNLTNKTTGRGIGFKTADLTFVQTALSNINNEGTAYMEVRLLPIYAIEGNYFGTPVCPSVATTTGVNYMVSKAGSAIQSCTGVLNVTTMRGSSISASVQEGADKSKFSISVGELVEGKATYTVTYTPTAANETATATIRFDDGTGNMRIADDNEADFTEITVQGCALPDRFVIAALVDGHYLALPENTTASAQAMSPIEVTYSAQLGGVRGAANSLLYSISSAQDSTLKINSHSNPFYANASGFRSATGAAGASYFWYVTRDGDTYRLRNTGMTGDNFPLAITYNSTSEKFNMIKETTAGSQYYRDLYLLPIVDESGDRMDIVDWNTDQIILNLNGIDPTKGVTASVNGGAATTITEGSHYTFKDTHLDRTYELSTGTLTAGEYVHLNLTYYDSKSNEYNSDRFYRVPYIYSDATVDKADYTTDDDIVVREGTVTINSSIAVHNVYVYPGAELVVKSGATLTCANLYVRMKAFAAGEVSGAIEATNTYYTFIIADKQYGLQLALPFASTVETINTTAGDTHTIGKNLKVNYYDAASRAESGVGNNWKALVGTTLSARTGYEIMSASAYYREYLFPVTYTQVTGEQQMAVTAPTGKLAAVNNGWNYIASPYTNKYIQVPSSEDDPEDMVKLSELNEDNKTYWQHVMMNIRPAIPFYYQAKEAGTLNFGTILSFEPETPKEIAARKINEPKVQTQWLVLALANANGQVDETNLYLHPSKFTVDYETGYDLEKMLGMATRPQLYSQMECGKLSFNAIPDDVAEGRIPLGYYAGQNEKQTFSLEQNAFLTRLEHVYLIDEQEQRTVDLLVSDYKFEAQAGEHTDRFFINCVFKKTPTDVDDVSNDDPGGPRKFIYKEKFYIENEGVIYNAEGKEVTL